MSENFEYEPDQNNNDTTKEEDMRQGQKMDGIGSTVEDFSGKFAEVASDLSNRTLSTIKKYPIHTALAAAGVGFLLGSLVSNKEV